MWLGTGHRSAAEGMSRQITHFGATGRGLGHPASTIAASRRYPVHLCGGVCPHGKGKQTDGDKEVERQPEGETAEAQKQKRRSSHGGSFNLEHEKTDSAGIPKCVLLEFYGYWRKVGTKVEGSTTS